VALLSSCAWSLPAIPAVQNHWVANSGGNIYDHVQNFIEDMTVDPDGTVRTWSSYDEGQHPNALYRDGAYTGPNWDTTTHASRRATYRGRTWTIRNFYGRGFFGNVAPPPTRPDSIPLVVSNAGDTIRSVPDPTALAFDSSGRLLVGDNGPDQNIKVFQVPNSLAPSRQVKLVDSIGTKGGVYAGPIPGRVGPKRFWGIRGIGVDRQGRLFVGCTGMPMQVGGGTHLRCFSSLSADTLVWELLGLAFVNTVDADPLSDGVSWQKNDTRFSMDWSAPPGRSWSFAAATVDPFRYPDDPRLDHSLESVWFRRIHGKGFLFLGDMYNSMLAMVRFHEPDSDEIGVPTAFFPVLNTYKKASSGPWVLGRRPVWDDSADASNYADKWWYWRDDNGDGQVGVDEFHMYSFRGQIVTFPTPAQISVDDSGDIWWGGKPYIVQFRAGPLDSRGVPQYSVDSIRIWDVPFATTPENNGVIIRPLYLPSKDVLVAATTISTGSVTSFYRYDSWSDPVHRKLRWKIDVPHKFMDSAASALPLGSSAYLAAADTCLMPKSVSIDSDYLYLAYVDKGPDAWRNGEVSVYRMDDGVRIGWVAPGPETGFMSGWTDLWHAVNPATRKNGEKLLSVEDDYTGKVNIYRWCPAGTCGGDTTAPPPPTAAACSDSQLPRLRMAGGALQVVASDTMAWRVKLHTMRGQEIPASGGWRYGNWSASSLLPTGSQVAHGTAVYVSFSTYCGGTIRKTPAQVRFLP
jgi:hypothetical protein